MFTFSASGGVTPPMIIYSLKRLPSHIQSSVSSKWGTDLSDNGWMQAKLFYKYAGNVLYPYLKDKNAEFPIILFVDGHRMHLTYNLSNLCSSLNIISCSTRILRPAGVAEKDVCEWRNINFASILEIVVKDIKYN
ncbi:hypothetical protein ILUMI_13752 [Ignelater luminosus]|uniref:DDE-1 domain-containing protein n=1 Tax=Ignelater luminosus TaxID=2038154 RepID=A0A8K0CW58_IGNLU|nr:hypothetical protein ILUMI_13752 [Ignelater luminosus]